MDATTGKALMRAQYKAVREGLSVGERRAIDEAIARNVAALPEFAAADAVFTYLSFGAEVDTRECRYKGVEIIEGHLMPDHV
ncbi:transposase, partial [Adlercreutzia sp. DFI.6.23]|uniref:transposase n=1 Tax=Adlercreutzia sp. DFI.6.23 TaxID=2963705 RepID=UPI002109F5BA